MFLKGLQKIILSLSILTLFSCTMPEVSKHYAEIKNFDDDNNPNNNVPIDGGWSNWTESASCSKSCGGGVHTFVRSCISPVPQNGGAFCVGESSKTESCNTHDCPVTNVPIDGGWSNWTESTSCSKSCGGGVKTFIRSCTNPAPQYGGANCVGSNSKTESCNTHACPNNKILSNNVICNKSDIVENTIVSYYREYCLRCADKGGFDFWVNNYNKYENMPAITQEISSQCAQKGLSNMSKCERQLKNAQETGCPSNYPYLPNHSNYCYEKCVTDEGDEKPIVFILSGQSNMWGAAKTAFLPDDDYLVHPANIVFNYAEPESSSLIKNSSLDNVIHFGPEISLIHNLSKKYKNRKVIIVKFAVGGTTIHHWNPDFSKVSSFINTLNPPGAQKSHYEKLYEKLISYINQAVRLDGDVEYGGMFWMQGESDAIHLNNNFLDLTKEFINKIRSDLRAYNLPFVLGRIHPGTNLCPWGDKWSNTVYFTEINYIRGEQIKLKSELNLVQDIETKSLSCPQNDVIHFDESSQITLGNLFYNGFLGIAP